MLVLTKCTYGHCFQESLDIFSVLQGINGVCFLTAGNSLYVLVICIVSYVAVTKYVFCHTFE